MTRFQRSASSVGGQIGRPPVDLGPLDGDGGQKERPGVRLPPPVEEVVGRRRHHRPVAETAAADSSDSSGVSTWLTWLAAKITGPSRSRSSLLAADQGGGHHPSQRAGQVVEHHGPGQTDRVLAGPRRCRSRTPELRGRSGPGHRSGPARARPAGNRSPAHPGSQGRGRQPAEGGDAPAGGPIASLSRAAESTATARSERNEPAEPRAGGHCTSAMRTGGV